MGLHPMTGRHTTFPKTPVALRSLPLSSGIPSTGQLKHSQSLESLRCDCAFIHAKYVALCSSLITQQAV